MKKYALLLLTAALLVSFAIRANRVQGISFFSPRSQSINAARDAVGWQQFINRYDAEHTYGVFTINPAYNRSVRPDRIAGALFGTDIVEISGSQVTNRAPQAFLADYFGLSPQFHSTVQFDPIIQSITIPCAGYIGLDALHCGLYFMYNFVPVWTRYEFRINEEIMDTGAGIPFPANYMDVAPVDAPISSFKDAFRGNVTFGQMQEPLRFGKIDCPRSKGGIADMQFILGWNFINHEYGRAGFNARLYAPTGSRPDSEYFFEPIVGNGKHWEAGIGFSGDVLLWEKDNEQFLRFYGIVNATHLFKARQRRSFDTQENGFGSRFILVKQFSPTNSYIGQLSPLINHTTLDVNVRIDLQFDIVFMINYTYCDWSTDFGYNGWIRSKEKIKLCEKPTLPFQTFGLKGIQDVSSGLVLVNTTQSMATLMGNELTQQAAVVDPLSPVFLSPLSLNPRSAASPRLTTHKFFAHISHAWEQDNATPFFGLGAEIEFQSIQREGTVQTDKLTMSQWGIWAKAGLSFDSFGC